VAELCDQAEHGDGEPKHAADFKSIRSIRATSQNSL
jgi:hypothetical protein